MPTIHFLNVKQGVCSVICHNSGRVTVIDVCNARPPDTRVDFSNAFLAQRQRGENGNFQQKRYPVNPISYLRKHNISSIHRYIQTHPDMDHMDGIKTLFEEFHPVNVWDTNNMKEIDYSSWVNAPYNEEDWQFYKFLRDTSQYNSTVRLTLLAGATGQYYTGNDGLTDRDGLDILAPTQQLINSANDTDQDYNDCSYVLLYRTGNNRIIFAGDSHDNTWTHILGNYSGYVANVDLLIAPHHGRDSGRSYEFLDILRPTLTFFGNAPSDNLAYSPWGNRGLSYITNNQANCMVVDASTTPMRLYVTHEHFARSRNASTVYNNTFMAWPVGHI